MIRQSASNRQYNSFLFYWLPYHHGNGVFLHWCQLVYYSICSSIASNPMKWPINFEEQQPKWLGNWCTSLFFSFQFCSFIIKLMLYHRSGRNLKHNARIQLSGSLDHSWIFQNTLFGNSATLHLFTHFTIFQSFHMAGHKYLWKRSFPQQNTHSTCKPQKEQW